MTMKIDVFPHILPRRYFDYLDAQASSRFHQWGRMRGLPVLFDLDERFRIMDRHEGYVQVLTLAAPAIEMVADPDEAPEFARLANDEMAALVGRYPDRFPGFVASLPMNNPEAALREVERAIGTLQATGVQIFSSVAGRPLDQPEFRPLFDRMAELDLPIWIHPARTAATADYPDESRSKYDIWWAFGWPYETSAAMARLVFSGLFDRQPNLKIITHHCGAMIPYFEGRVGGGLDQARQAQRRSGRPGRPRTATPATDRLLPPLLRGHRPVRLDRWIGVRLRVLRPGARPVRDGHAVRPGGRAGLRARHDRLDRADADHG